MRRVTPIVLGASGALVVLDAVGALAAKPLGFPYSSLGVISLTIYLLVGMAGAWRAGLAAALAAAALVGFLDATLGPMIAWLIGPGPVGQTITEPRIFAYGIAVITVTATAVGLVGAAIGVWLERRRAVRGSGAISR